MFLAHTRRALSTSVLVALLLGPVAAALWAKYTVGQLDVPGDQALAENFFAHEKSFAELVLMLNADRAELSQARAGAIDLAALKKVLEHARAEKYVADLNTTSVADLRYFPDSGRLVLLPKGTSPDIAVEAKYYLYLARGEPEPSARYDSHWRGPGTYILSGDRPLKQSWFIHHNATISVVLSPY